MTGGAAEQIEQVDRQRGTSSDGAGTDRARLSGHAILVRYVLFAAVAGLSNLATQEAVAQALPSAPIMVSIAAGTPVGFLVKYLLDKRWVFLDPYDNHIAELRKIILYGIFGAGTTMLFCAIELSFWHIWGTDEAKYIGAAIGLVIGYWMKFLLDKKLVFSRMIRFPADPFGIPETVSPKTPCSIAGFSAIGIRLEGLISRKPYDAGDQ